MFTQAQAVQLKCFTDTKHKNIYSVKKILTYRVLLSMCYKQELTQKVREGILRAPLEHPENKNGATFTITHLDHIK